MIFEIWRFVVLFVEIPYFSVAPIIRSPIGNTLYRLIFSYRLSDRYVCQITSRSDIIAGQS